MFFFEKKNQKTFTTMRDGRPMEIEKVFLLLFLQKKKILSSLEQYPTVGRITRSEYFRV